MADYKKAEDLLGLGEHVLEVSPQEEYKDGAFISGSHRSGEGKKGFKWWMYKTKIGGEYVKLFASEKNKKFFDSGRVVCVVKKKFNPDNGQPYNVAYFNECID